VLVIEDKKGRYNMQQSGSYAPIFSEQSLLIIGGGIMLILLAAGVAFTIILKDDPSKIKDFRGGRALHYVTIVVVVFAAGILALEGVLSGEAVSSILGGIVGYVLGTLTSQRAHTSNEPGDS
jgi:hypothetical protein